jgi:2-C-methyl-D-erythritol 4-phosphate cytidylyltransferase/2-C-methyl-D-erythritol 2,4-cyclodiphosphate synthase
LSGPDAGARVDVVIVAAGGSARMGGIDKLDAPLIGRPLLAWSVGAFSALPEVARLLVVTASDRVAGVREAPWLPAGAEVVAGGARRQDSVAAGVRALDGTPDRVVLVHDGARPCVTPSVIRRVAAAAAEHGAAIPVIPVVETLKELDGERVGRTVDRSRLAAAQTPQAVRRSLLEAAWRRFPPESEREFTDEAALLEACTITVHAIPGDPSNLKVTFPADLSRAETVLRGGLPGAPIRVASGSDTHAFGPGRPLRLGGLEFADAPRLHGHSDGDVALHAVADALLGAAGLPDLGRQFPADASTPQGIASDRLLAAVLERLRAAGVRPHSVDLTIVGARPRLGTRLDEMRSAIAGVLAIDVGAVSIKASSGNFSGPEGAGRVVSAHAVASVERVGP